MTNRTRYRWASSWFSMLTALIVLRGAGCTLEEEPGTGRGGRTGMDAGGAHGRDASSGSGGAGQVGGSGPTGSGGKGGAGGGGDASTGGKGGTSSGGSSGASTGGVGGNGGASTGGHGGGTSGTGGSGSGGTSGAAGAGTAGRGGANAGGSSGAGGTSTAGASGVGGSNSGGASGAGGASSGGRAGAGGSSTGGSSGAGAGGAGAGGAGTDGGTGILHFVAYGDTRSNPGTHQQVIDGIAKLNPELVIQTGDLWDGYTQDQFRNILTKNANLAALLNNGKFVVSVGNHESTSEYLAFTPSLSRGNKTDTFSYVEGNSFFVVLGMNPSGKDAFLDQQLQKPEAQAARWRFVYSHYPIYSGGEHGASGNSAVEKICDKHQVAIYFSGHDHIYERTFQMKASAPVDQDDDLVFAAGTVYIVAGGGGAPLYTSAKKSWTRVNASTNHYIDVVASDSRMNVKVQKLDGSQLDAFTIAR